MGSTAAALGNQAKDVSNPQSWEETAFEVVNPSYTLFNQFKPQRCTLTYYNKRLYSARCEFPRDQFEAIYTNFVAQRKAPANREFSRADKSATWYGEFRDGNFSYMINMYQLGSATAVVYSDETQKAFRFGDLFKGSLPWVILTIIGLFCGYLVFGWLMTSKCPKCKKRKLRITGKSFKNPTDYNPELLGTPDIHWDEIYHSKCANCGFEKDDRYSGFWSWYRSQ
jgi:hypothetical protein